MTAEIVCRGVFRRVDIRSNLRPDSTALLAARCLVRIGNTFWNTVDAEANGVSKVICSLL